METVTTMNNGLQLNRLLGQWVEIRKRRTVTLKIQTKKYFSFLIAFPKYVSRRKSQPLVVLLWLYLGMELNKHLHVNTHDNNCTRTHRRPENNFTLIR